MVFAARNRGKRRMSPAVGACRNPIWLAGICAWLTCSFSVRATGDILEPEGYDLASIDVTRSSI